MTATPETVTETVNPESDVETKVIDGQNGDDVTNSVSETAEESAPRFVMPETVEDLDFGDPLFNSLGAEIMKARTEVSNINLKLARQQDEFSDDKLIENAKSETEDKAVQVAYQKLEKLLAQIETVRNAVISAVLEKIGDEKLSDEQISALKETADQYSAVIKNTTGVLTSLLPTRMDLDENQRDFVTWFAENATVPGARRNASGNSASTQGGQKPRLKGGRVVINGNKDYPNLGMAAKAISEIAKKDVATEELLSAWLNAAGVNDWKDTPADSEFTFTYPGTDVKVMIWRNSK